ncbi:DUF6946 family protein [Sutcliffiella sp. NC1]
MNFTSLKEEDVLDNSYQLLHQTASTHLEAERIEVKNANILLHSSIRE